MQALQVKLCTSDKKAKKWLKETQKKEIVDIKYTAGGIRIIYKE